MRVWENFAVKIRLVCDVAGFFDWIPDSGRASKKGATATMTDHPRLICLPGSVIVAGGIPPLSETDI